MARRDIIVVGTSAGGVEALTQLVGGLPATLPASIFIVLHLPATSTSFLPRILSRAGPLPAEHPTNGQSIEQGRIYVAPPDHHLVLRAGRIHLSRGPRENGHRPAVDILFRSAAREYGGRVIGVVLSGTLDDGTAGLLAVKTRGGVAVAQDPEDALFSGMPTSAGEAVELDYCLPVAEIGQELARLSQPPIEVKGLRTMANGTDIAGNSLDLDTAENEYPSGPPSVFTCPECHGTLWELREGELALYRCRVGHQYSQGVLLAEQSEALEAALWTGLRAIQERSDMARRMAQRAQERGQSHMAERFLEQVRDGDRNSQLLREVLLSGATFRGDGAPLEAEEA